MKNVKNSFEKNPNNVIFWNGMVTLIMGFLWFLQFDIALFVTIVMSVVSLFILLTRFEDSRHDSTVRIIGDDYWMFLSPTIGALVILALVIFCIAKLVMYISKLILNFNKFLNKN